uniref:brain mitochondrial carrier protein 1 isoform X1 n=2 Tax=Pristiophorus japonicus TaxID=55135 RepID=UPI00398F71A0
MSNLNWKPFVYGGLASVTAEFGTFPIDLTKTRLQVQGQIIDSQYKEIKYRGMFHALLRICKEEGLRALYSGISPALLRQASYGTIKIGTYQSLKRLFVSRPEDETLFVNVLCGILAGVVSSSIANPTDVLKIRMQAQSGLCQGSMIGNFIHIYQQEGTRGLWRGVSLTAQRAAIVVGVELPVYDITKKHIILSGWMGDTVYTHFLPARLKVSWLCTKDSGQTGYGLGLGTSFSSLHMNSCGSSLCNSMILYRLHMMLVPLPGTCLLTGRQPASCCLSIHPCPLGGVVHVCCCTRLQWHCVGRSTLSRP